jgi:hypothetical protein
MRPREPDTSPADWILAARSFFSFLSVRCVVTPGFGSDESAGGAAGFRVRARSAWRPMAGAVGAVCAFSMAITFITSTFCRRLGALGALGARFVRGLRFLGLRFVLGLRFLGLRLDVRLDLRLDFLFRDAGMLLRTNTFTFLAEWYGVCGSLSFASVGCLDAAAICVAAVVCRCSGAWWRRWCR